MHSILKTIRFAPHNRHIFILFFSIVGIDHPAEMVENTFLSDGHHSLSVTAPAYAVPANTFARCRISSGGGLSPIGAALDGEVEDHSLTVDDGYVDWGRLQYPTNVTINAYIGTMSEDIYGRCWHDGLTPPSTNAAPGLVAQVGYGPDGSDTPWDSNWNWFNTSFNSQTMEPNNDEYVGVVTIPSAGTYDYAFRYSLNSIDWTYADADGSNNGYTNTQAGDIVVTALPKISITNITTVITSDRSQTGGCTSGYYYLGSADCRRGGKSCAQYFSRRS